MRALKCPSFNLVEFLEFFSLLVGVLIPIRIWGGLLLGTVWLMIFSLASKGEMSVIGEMHIEITAFLFDKVAKHSHSESILFESATYVC